MTAAVAAAVVLGQLWAAGVASGAPVDSSSGSPAPVATAEQPQVVSQAQVQVLSDAIARVQSLEAQAKISGAQIVEAQAAATQAQAEVDAIKKQIAYQQVTVAQLTDQARTVALAQFRSSPLSTTVQIVTSSNPDTVMGQLSIQNWASQRIDDQLQQQQLEQANLLVMQRQMAAKAAALKDATQTGADLSAQLQRDLSDAKALVAQLTPGQQKTVTTATGLQSEFASYMASHHNTYGKYHLGWNGCTTLAAWYVGTHTDLVYGNGNGDEVVRRLVGANPGASLSVSDTPVVPAVFSVAGHANHGAGAWGSSGSGAGHTGLVIGVDGNLVTVLSTAANLSGDPNRSEIATYVLPDADVTFANLGSHVTTRAP